MTSIEWLEKNIRLNMNPFELIECFNQAKEMHKKEILDAYIDRMDCTNKEHMRKILGEQYYNETFKKD